MKKLFRKWSKKCKNNNNDIIACLAEFIRKRIKVEMSEYHAIITDEVTDQFSNKEILLLCSRYLTFQNGLPIIHETFGLPIIHGTIDSLPINGRPTGGIIGEKFYLYYKKMKLILRNVEHRMVQVLHVAIAQELLLGLKNSDHLQNIPMAETISLT